MPEKSRFSSLVRYVRSLKNMAFGTGNRPTQPVVLNREIVNKILQPLHLMTAFIGHRSKHYPILGSLGLVIWIVSLVCHFSLDFYEAAHIFGWAWATAIGLFFISFSSGTYILIRDTLPWFEDCLEILNVDGNFSETLEKAKKFSSKLPLLLLVSSVLAACGQYFCYFIDNAVQVELGKPWLTVLLNIVRVVSLLHVLYGYILFLIIILFVMYITGASMKEFRDGVECEFRERHVRMTFREAVQLFEHRSQFIRRSSNACLYMLCNIVLTTVLSFVINGYNFLFFSRRAIYLWFALVPMIWTAAPLILAAWATENYQAYVASVVRSWGEHPESDEGDSEGDDMEEYQEAMKKLKVNRSRSVLIASTNLLTTLKRKRLILRQDRRMSAAAMRRESQISEARSSLEDVAASIERKRNLSIGIQNPLPLQVDDIKTRDDDTFPQAGLPSTCIVNSSSTTKGINTQTTKEKRKSKFNFKSYVMYLQGLISEVGFSVGGMVLSWEKVSSIGILWVSVLAIFIQEIVFGNRKSTLLT
ncbi:uncharacterized protein [Montipora capricornis]|uniref:uncharacterized protein n=1 Tax=Montipora capricornis TaxID=246305 RepID=UPI0035F1F2F0